MTSPQNSPAVYPAVTVHSVLSCGKGKHINQTPWTDQIKRTDHTDFTYHFQLYDLAIFRPYHSQLYDLDIFRPDTFLVCMIYAIHVGP